LKYSDLIYSKTSIYFVSMVVVMVVYNILSAEVRQIPNNDSAVLHIIIL